MLNQRPHFDPSFGWNGIKKQWNSLADITNFYINNSGIVIYFDDYEIASYNEGGGEYTILWSEAMQDIGMHWSGEKMAKALMLDDSYY